MSINFKTTMTYVIKELVTEGHLTRLFPDAFTRLQKLIDYNVPYLSEIRYEVVVDAYKNLHNNEISNEQLQKVYILGCLVQMLQAYLTLLDDLVDGGETRFGKPLWVNLKENKILAANDIMLLEHATFRLLIKHFGDQPDFCLKLVDYFSNSVYQNCLATIQHLETEKVGNERYSMKYFQNLSLANNQYVMQIPIQVAMLLAGLKETDELWKRVDKITQGLTMFFTVRDDLMDSFGKNQNNSIIDTDIRTGKLTWLIVNAHAICKPEDWAILESEYGKGKKESVKIVKKMLANMKIPQLCEEYLISLKDNLQMEIRQLIEEGHSIGDTLLCVLHMLDKLQE